MAKELKVSTVEQPPVSFQIVLNATRGQNTAVTTWEQEVEVPDSVAQFRDNRDAPLGQNSDPEYGVWIPVKTNKRLISEKEKEYKFTQTTNWAQKDSLYTNSLVNFLTQPQNLQAQLSKLTKFVINGDLYAQITGNTEPEAEVSRAQALLDSIDPKSSNLLGFWNFLIAGATVKSTNLKDIKLMETLGKDGKFLATLIAMDMPQEDINLNNILDVLADYFLFLDPDPGPEATLGQLVFLLDDTGSAVDLESAYKIIEWTEDEQHTTAKDRMISCSYYRPGDTLGIYKEGTKGAIIGGEVSPLNVKNPAATLAEAKLEVSLQRQHLIMDKNLAGATIELAPKIRPLTILKFRDQRWKVKRVTHKVPVTGLMTTDLQLWLLEED